MNTYDCEAVNAECRRSVFLCGHAKLRDVWAVKALSSSGARLSTDGRIMQLAQFPNVGYCHIERILDKGAVYDPQTITELIYFNTGKLLFPTG